MVKQFKGMGKFTVIWVGQFVSLVGTSMTAFVLTIWAYQQSSRALTIALLIFSHEVIYLIITLIAGPLIDRWDRRRIMIISDSLAGMITVILFILFSLGQLQTWHLYIGEGLWGALSAFQIPAYTAASSTLIPKAQFSRASGMRSFALYASRMLAPPLAGSLLGMIDVSGVMMIDIATVTVAISTLIVTPIPAPDPTTGVNQHEGSLLDGIKFGWAYIKARPGLLGLMLSFTALNLFAALTYFSILPAMILARSGGQELVLAAVQTAMSAGGLIGGIVLSLWGGPQRKIKSILVGAALSFFMGDLLFGIGRSLPVWLFAGFCAAFFIPFIVGENRAIWQSKVPPAIQGRVFSVQSAIGELAMPAGYLLGGLLADFVFEPAFMPGGSLVDTFGWLVGSGPGAGMGFMFVMTWWLGITASLAGYMFKAVRNVEDDLLDYDEQ